MQKKRLKGVPLKGVPLRAQVKEANLAPLCLLPQVSIITAVLLLSLHAAPAWSSKRQRCYSEEELSEAAEKKLSTYYLQSHNLPARGAVASDSTTSFTCPLHLYQQQQNLKISMRSVSPWTYV